MEVKLKGHECLHQRLLLSTISGRSLEVSQIRVDESGLHDYEACLLRLLEKLTSGMRVEINETGSCLKYTPGVLRGGNFSFRCSTSRGLSYFLDFLVCLLPFCSEKSEITLFGSTDHSEDISVDSFKANLTQLRRISFPDFEIKLKKRGLPPKGNGEVLVTSEVLKNVEPFEFIQEGVFKKIRGVAYASSVSPHFSARLVDAARGLLNRLLPDVWIFNDSAKNTSKGYGVSLQAESVKGQVKSADCHAFLDVDEETDPEVVGRLCASRLLQEIELGGVCDFSFQHLLIYFAALSEEYGSSRFRLTRVSPYAKRFLIHVKIFLGIVFEIQEEEENEEVEEPEDEVEKLHNLLKYGGRSSKSLILSCVGCGIQNLARRRM